MARPKGSYREPSYRLHRASGQAVVTLAGKDVYLGPYGSESSKSKYHTELAEWRTRGQVSAPSAVMTVSEVAAGFWTYALRRYAASGAFRSSRTPIKLLRSMYGETPAAEFTPLKLKAVREACLAKVTSGRQSANPGERWSRRHINDVVKRIKGVFRWASENELVPGSVFHALLSVKPLRPGESEARETSPVLPVDDVMVDAILPFLTPVLRAVVQIQRFTGARGSEILTMRPADVDRSGKAWLYRPRRHKSQHHGHGRIIQIGPRAQQELAPFLDRAGDAYCFTPRESCAQHHARRRTNAKRPLGDGDFANRDYFRRIAVAGGKKRIAFRPYYSASSYVQMVQSACLQAFPPPGDLARQRVKGAGRGPDATRWEFDREWRARLGPGRWAEMKAWHKAHRFHPHQLRHLFATRVNEAGNMDAARQALGHQHESTTRRYVHSRPDGLSPIIAQIG